MTSSTRFLGFRRPLRPGHSSHRSQNALVGRGFDLQPQIHVKAIGTMGKRAYAAQVTAAPLFGLDRPLHLELDELVGAHSVRSHTFCERDRSAPGRNPRKFASRAFGRRQPECCGRCCLGSPRDRAWAARLAGMFQCHAGSLGMSIMRRRGKGTGLDRRSHEGADFLDTVVRTSRTHGEAGNP